MRAVAHGPRGRRGVVGAPVVPVAPVFASPVVVSVRRGPQAASATAAKVAKRKVVERFMVSSFRVAPRRRHREWSGSRLPAATPTREAKAHSPAPKVSPVTSGRPAPPGRAAGWPGRTIRIAGEMSRSERAGPVGRRPSRMPAPPVAKRLLGHPGVLGADAALVRVERVRRAAQDREIDVAQEAAGVIRGGAVLAGEPDQAGDLVHGCSGDAERRRALGWPSGAALLVVRGAGVVHRVVKPERRLDRSCVAGSSSQRRRAA